MDAALMADNSTLLEEIVALKEQREKENLARAEKEREEEESRKKLQVERDELRGRNKKRNAKSCSGRASRKHKRPPPNSRCWNCAMKPKEPREASVKPSRGSPPRTTYSPSIFANACDVPWGRLDKALLHQCSVS